MGDSPRQHQHGRNSKFRRDFGVPSRPASKGVKPRRFDAGTNPNLHRRGFRQLFQTRRRPQSLKGFQNQLRKLVERWYTQYQQQGKDRQVYREQYISLTHWQDSLSQWAPRLRGLGMKFSVGLDLGWALLPVIREASAATLDAFASRRLPFLDSEKRRQLNADASTRGDNVAEMMQHIYFQRTWLDSWTVTAVCRICAGLASLLHMIFYYDQSLRPWQAGVARRRYESVPVSGYDAFMVGYLLIGQAMGFFRGGAGRLQLLQIDSFRFPAALNWRLGPADAPRSASEAIADIDQMYWAESPGFLIKIVRVEVGPHSSRVPRWIVILPGTDHLAPTTTSNPADFQSNIKEVLGYPSTVREGVRRAILAAMSECGITGSQVERQQVVVVGHSQGGLIGSALAIAKDVPFKVVGLVSAGAPIGKIPVNPNVVQVALRHDQDVVYSLDGCDGKLDPSIVLLTRSLEEPKRGALYYAHSAGTYVETARLMESWAESEPNSQVGRACHFINDLFPKQGETTTVFHYQVTQEVLSAPPTPVLQMDQFRRGSASTVAPVNIIDEEDVGRPLLPSERANEDE